MARLALLLAVLVSCNLSIALPRRLKPWSAPKQQPAVPPQSRMGTGRILKLAVDVRGGAEVLTLDRSPIGTLALMLRAFFASLTDPTYMMDLEKPDDEDDVVDEADENPFAARADTTRKTITVDELDKLGSGPSRVRNIKNSADFNKVLASAGNKLVVCDFFATWCGPCKQIAPQFAELSGSYSKVKFLKVDVDANRDLSQKYQVSSMPTFVFLKNGKVVDKISGANIDAVRQKVSSLS